MNKSAFTYDSFVPGVLIGHTTDIIEQKLIDDWIRLYPWETIVPGEVPSAISTVIMMKAYLRIVSPRPPGNIHAKQYAELTSSPSIGETVLTGLKCLSKEVRRERRFVNLEARSTGDGGRALFVGCMSLIWAA